MLGQRGGRRELDLRAGAGGGEHAELVAPETIGPPMGPDAALERLAQAREQRVAREVAEGVVVVLEAIEVEEEQHRRVGGPGRAGLEVGHELAAVGQAGQAVARRGGLELAARCAQRQRGERHEHQGHGQDGEWPRPDVAYEPRCGVGRGGHEDPVIGIAVTAAQMPVGRHVPVDLGHALRARASRQGGEAAVAGHAEGRADLLRAGAVDDHGAGPGVDDVQPVHAVVCPQLAAEALDGQLVVHDRHRAMLRTQGDRCGVADHPVVRVGRHVGP